MRVLQRLPAEIRESWTVIAAAFVGSCLGLIQLASQYTIGVLTPSLTAEFGWGRGQVLLVPVAVYAGLFLATPVVGILIDKVGVRRITLFSLCSLAAGFVALAVSTHGSLTLFLAIYFLIGLLGAGAGPLTYSRSVISWFVENRGLALGLSLAGAGLAGFILPNYVGQIILLYGWRSAYWGIAVLPVLIAFPVTYFWLKEVRPTADRLPVVGRSQAVDPEPFYRSFRYWLMVVIFGVVAAATIGLITNLVPFLMDRGFSLTDAAAVSSLLGIAVIVGRVGIGALMDKFYVPMLAIAVLAPTGVMVYVLTLPNIGFLSALIAVVMVGIVTGAEFDMLPYLLARYFGEASYGKSYAIAYLFLNLLAAMAPALFGFSYDWLGSYRISFLSVAVIFVLLPFGLLFLGDYPDETAGP